MKCNVQADGCISYIFDMLLYYRDYLTSFRPILSCCCMLCLYVSWAYYLSQSKAIDYFTIHLWWHNILTRGRIIRELNYTRSQIVFIRPESNMALLIFRTFYTCHFSFLVLPLEGINKCMQYTTYSYMLILMRDIFGLLRLQEWINWRWETLLQFRD